VLFAIFALLMLFYIYNRLDFFIDVEDQSRVACCMCVSLVDVQDISEVMQGICLLPLCDVENHPPLTPPPHQHLPSPSLST
jgi:hypothetical protein